MFTIYIKDLSEPGGPLSVIFKQILLFRQTNLVREITLMMLRVTTPQQPIARRREIEIQDPKPPHRIRFDRAKSNDLYAVIPRDTPEDESGELLACGFAC